MTYENLTVLFRTSQMTKERLNDILPVFQFEGSDVTGVQTSKEQQFEHLESFIDFVFRGILSFMGESLIIIVEM